MNEVLVEDTIEVAAPTESYAPNAFDVENHRRNALEGRQSRFGIEMDLISGLSEMAGLPFSVPIELDIVGIPPDAYLESAFFAGEKYLDILSSPTGQPIYDLRAPFEVMGLKKIEGWCNESNEDFNWVLFSPTTELNGEVMSNTSMVEFGRRVGDKLHVFRLSIPHREGQTVEEVRIEIEQLARSFASGVLDFDPEDTFPADFTNPEVRLLRSPIKLPHDITRDQIVAEVDKRLGEIAGSRFYMGREVGGDNGFDPEAHQVFDRIVDKLRSSGWLQRYVDQCFVAGSDLQGSFNAIANSFLDLWNSYRFGVETGGIDLHGDSSDWISFYNLEWNDDELSEQIKGDCGGYGGESGGRGFTAKNEIMAKFGGYAGDMIRSGVKLPEIHYFVGKDDYGSREFNCPSCGALIIRPMNQYVYNCPNMFCHHYKIVFPGCG